MRSSPLHYILQPQRWRSALLAAGDVPHLCFSLDFRDTNGSGGRVLPWASVVGAQV